MKKWIKPNLITLGVEMTMNDSDAFTPKPHGGHCHASNNTCDGLVNDHSADGNKNHTWTGNPCSTHVEGNNGQPGCCCGPISIPMS